MAAGRWFARSSSEPGPRRLRDFACQMAHSFPHAHWKDAGVIWTERSQMQGTEPNRVHSRAPVILQERQNKLGRVGSLLLNAILRSNSHRTKVSDGRSNYLLDVVHQTERKIYSEISSVSSVKSCILKNSAK